MTKKSKQNKNEAGKEPKVRSSAKGDIFNAVNISKSQAIAALIIAFIVGLIHRFHVANMFENDRHFSYLSDLEREMTFRTEMGLYYSYYKSLINAPSLIEGLNLIVNDNVTEFGHTINTLKRFNLYPELLLSVLYKIYMAFTSALNITTEQCWRTERGKDLEPILSCEGMGNVPYFYINNVFVLTSLSAASIFLIGFLISNSLLGGIIACACFFFNHGEATRVQWTPPLRESFGYPLFSAQMLLTTFILKYRKQGLKWSLFVAFLTTSFMLSWQFASFALSTQVGCIFLTYILGYATNKTLRTLSVGLLIGLSASFVLLFGNEMLLTSLFLSSLITVQVMLWAENYYHLIKYRVLIVVAQVLTFAAGTLAIKFAFGYIFNVKDDAHVFDILKAKFTDYKDFHTQLYICAAEFDFMQLEMIWKLALSLVLPAACLALLIEFVHFIQIEFNDYKVQKKISCKPNGEVLYNIMQLAAFTVMAILIMRLKLFFTPHLCIICSLLASKSLFKDVLGKYAPNRLWHNAACALLIALMAISGVKNLKQQFAVMGEYSNVQQENLFMWINKFTDPNAVFAGPMPTMANLKLSTGRPIVNHPHYEDAGIRERTFKVYSMFSRKPAEQVYNTLKDMGVQYFVFESGWCSKSKKAGCAMPELFDIHDIENRGKDPLCEKIMNNDLGPFKIAYENKHYKLLKIT